MSTSDKTFNPMASLFDSQEPTQKLPKDLVSVAGKKVAESDRAVCFIPEYLDSYENLEQESVWIPLSQVAEIHPDRIVMQRWIAEKKGLAE